MTYVVVAFLLLVDGSAHFHKSGTFTDRTACELEAKALALLIDDHQEEIQLFASQCIPNYDSHYPGKDET